MKVNCVLQYNGKDTSVKDYEKQVVEVLKEKEVKRKDIESLDLYFNANEGTMYYVAVTKLGFYKGSL